jgi:hypothetical protein
VNTETFRVLDKKGRATVTAMAVVCVAGGISAVLAAVITSDPVPTLAYLVSAPLFGVVAFSFRKVPYEARVEHSGVVEFVTLWRKWRTRIDEISGIGYTPSRWGRGRIEFYFGEPEVELNMGYAPGLRLADKLATLDSSIKRFDF